MPVRMEDLVTHDGFQVVDIYIYRFYMAHYIEEMLDDRKY